MARLRMGQLQGVGDEQIRWFFSMAEAMSSTTLTPKGLQRTETAVLLSLASKGVIRFYVFKAAALASTTAAALLRLFTAPKGDFNLAALQLWHGKRRRYGDFETIVFSRELLTNRGGGQQQNSGELLSSGYMVQQQGFGMLRRDKVLISNSLGDNNQTSPVVAYQAVAWTKQDGKRWLQRKCTSTSTSFLLDTATSKTPPRLQRANAVAAISGMVLVTVMAGPLLGEMARTLAADRQNGRQDVVAGKHNWEEAGLHSKFFT